MSRRNPTPSTSCALHSPNTRRPRASSWAPRPGSSPPAAGNDTLRRGLLDPLLDELFAALFPFLGGHGVSDVVLPNAVDLEVALGDALLTQVQLLDHPPAVAVAGDDGDLDAMQLQVFEGEAHHDDESLGDIGVAGELLADPVTDVRVLERPPLQP